MKRKIIIVVSILGGIAALSMLSRSTPSPTPPGTIDTVVEATSATSSSPATSTAECDYSRWQNAINQRDAIIQNASSEIAALNDTLAHASQEISAQSSTIAYLIQQFMAYYTPPAQASNKCNHYLTDPNLPAGLAQREYQQCMGTQTAVPTPLLCEHYLYSDPNVQNGIRNYTSCLAGTIPD